MTKMIGLFEIYSVVNSHNEMNMNKCRPMLMMAPLWPSQCYINHNRIINSSYE